MRHPWVNTVLLVLLLAQLVTGFGGLLSGGEDFRWVLWLHGIEAATPSSSSSSGKGAVIAHAWMRRRRPALPRTIFVALTVLVTTQVWRGITIYELLDLAGVKPAVRSVTVEAATGYGRRFSIQQARGYVLATHVAGQPLDHGHGFPLRLVTVDHRGLDWVKWVSRVRVDDTSDAWQTPVPLQ